LSAVAKVLAVGDHEVAVDRGEAVGDPDDASEQRRFFDLQRSRRSASRRGRDGRRDDHRHGFPVRRLPDPEAGCRSGVARNLIVPFALHCCLHAAALSTSL
jgi:hypothetical protein